MRMKRRHDLARVRARTRLVDGEPRVGNIYDRDLERDSMRVDGLIKNMPPVTIHHHPPHRGRSSLVYAFLTFSRDSMRKKTGMRIPLRGWAPTQKFTQVLTPPYPLFMRFVTRTATRSAIQSSPSSRFVTARPLRVASARARGRPKRLGTLVSPFTTV